MGALGGHILGYWPLESIYPGGVRPPALPAHGSVSALRIQSPAAVAPRLSELTEKLKQEEQDREVACGALQKSQEEVGQKLDHQVARMQVPGRPRPGPGV